jgi:hypothetical protein
MFESVVAVAFQSAFIGKYIKIFFLFLKIIFDISASK